ncbi:hypothetical protein [Persicirhabdus sediminis]|nr:hypothetical protein [Persicirhabdus sediminis]
MSSDQHVSLSRSENLLLGLTKKAAKDRRTPKAFGRTMLPAG